MYDKTRFQKWFLGNPLRNQRAVHIANVSAWRAWRRLPLPLGAAAAAGRAAIVALLLLLWCAVLALHAPLRHPENVP